MDKKIEFLYSAISDAQELIRFIDTKTSFVVTILAAYLVTFFTVIDRIIEYHSFYSEGFWLFFISFLVLLTCCISVTARIIRPTNNPRENINLGGSSEPTLKFFLSPNEYSEDEFYPLSNSASFKLRENFELYVRLLSEASDEIILNTLTYELFKVSYIRNIKNDRFTVLLGLLVATTISFFIAYLFFVNETHRISEHIKKH